MKVPGRPQPGALSLFFTAPFHFKNKKEVTTPSCEIRTMDKLYCNPLPLPDYQPGMAIIQPELVSWGWSRMNHQDYREMADPTVIRFHGRYYLFPSCGMLWYSDDLVDWTYHPIEPREPGYAPTVVEMDGWLYMTACSDRMWRAREPLGPWEEIGIIRDENGDRFYWQDPYLFVDGGTLYCYHGLGRDGIYVAKMRDGDPTVFDGPRVHCFGYNPDHIWERAGEHHQNPEICCVEGAWMTKHNSRYYLQYSAPGTELKCYSLGCYQSEHPMGPFHYQERSPILTECGGLINGTGHHSVVEGPNGTLWCIYTTLVRIEHLFERRVAMDPVGFDPEGNIFVDGPSETPQLAPGVKPDPHLGNSAGLLKLSVNVRTHASSFAPGHEPEYAVDDVIRTWWEAEPADPEPALLVDLGRDYTTHSARTLFADRGLDYHAGVLPGPYQYIIEASSDGETWATLLDSTNNQIDRHIAFDQWPPAQARYIRLRITAWPPGMRVGIWEFTVFGKADRITQ